MKLRNLIYPSIFVSIIFLIYNVALSKKLYVQTEASLVIKSSKSNYLEGEPVWIEHLFKADKNVKIDYKPLVDPRYDLKFIIINSKRDTLKYLGGVISVIASKYSGDSIWGSDNLLYYYGIPERFPDSKLLGQYYIPADSYSIQAHLRIPIENKLHMIESNKINIMVLKPTGEDSLAYNKWQEIQDKAKFDKAFTNLENNVKEFTETYPNSVYLDKVRAMLLSYSFIIPDSDQFVNEFALEEIKRNPDSYYNYAYLSSLEGRNQDKNSFQLMIQELKNNYKNTLLERIINNQFTEVPR